MIVILTNYLNTAFSSLCRWSIATWLCRQWPLQRLITASASPEEFSITGPEHSQVSANTVSICCCLASCYVPLLFVLFFTAHTLQSSWSPLASIWIHRISSTVSSATSPQHFLGPVHFLSPNQQSGIHCLIICTTQLLTPNNLGIPVSEDVFKQNLKI